MKIHPVGAELLHANGWTEKQQTDMMQLTVTFHTFMNTPKEVTNGL